MPKKLPDPIPPKNEYQDDSDNSSLDIDVDNELEYDSNEDDIYDPVTEFPEDEDKIEDEENLDDDNDDEGEEEDNIDDDENDDENEDEWGIEEKPKKKGSNCHMEDISKIFICDDDSNTYNKMQYVKVDDDKRIYHPNMTYYEMVRIIGTRAKQFEYGAPPLIKNVDNLLNTQKAYLELLAGMTPFIIRRNFPGKKYELWKISEMKIIHKFDDETYVPQNFKLEDIKY